MFSRVSVAKEVATQTAKTSPRPASSLEYFAPQETTASDVSGPAYSLAGLTLLAHGGGGDPESPSEGASRPLPWPIQAKLEVGAADDPLEREADRIADHVMRMPETGSADRPVLSRATSGVRRKCTCGGSCEKCKTEQSEDERGRVQKKPTATAGSGHISAPSVAPPIVHQALRSSGQPLDAATRSFFEPRFGYDFSRVRLHADGPAAESAKAIQARAYTVGRDVVFAQNQLSTSTREGKRLLAHELAHIVQQGGGESAVVRRDLATPPPDPAAPPQTDLTPAQIREAINFNSQRYDAANTRLIQRILGGPVTGRWTTDNIVAIAATQEEYGLKKDGKVGPDTFAFINQEQTAEGAGTDTANCLTSFQVTVFPLVDASATPGPAGSVHIEGHHHIDVRFSPRCDCSQFEYRQFVAGVATASLGTATRDISDGFSLIPGGRLPITEVEDGTTACTSAVHYGHRKEAGHGPGGTVCPESRYRDDDGTLNQASGCHFSADDRPDITSTGLPTGTTVNLDVDFRGEIRRNGSVIQTRRWTTIDTSVTVP